MAESARVGVAGAAIGVKLSPLIDSSFEARVSPAPLIAETL